MIKECIQSAVINGKHIEKSLQKMLWSYYKAPKLVKGISPFLVLKGLNPNAKLFPSWMGGGERKNVDLEKCSEKVKNHQEKSKSWYDNKHGAKAEKWLVEIACG